MVSSTSVPEGPTDHTTQGFAGGGAGPQVFSMDVPSLVRLG
jgi:hypothetical protein